MKIAMEWKPAAVTGYELWADHVLVARVRPQTANSPEWFAEWVRRTERGSLTNFNFADAGKAMDWAENVVGAAVRDTGFLEPTFGKRPEL